MRDISARRALTHPAWLAAAGVLLANDHVLKGAGLLPAIVTGKLSDLAGLFLAPALVSTFVFARSRRAVLLVHVAVATMFAVVKLVPWATHALEGFLSLFVASRVWTDPTDLVALPMVALSWRVFVPRMMEDSTGGNIHRGVQTVVGATGALMCMATSQEVSRPLQIHNGTRERVTITVRQLSSEVRIDDAIVFSSTPLPFSPAAFAPAIGAGVLSLEGGETIGVNGLRGRVLLVDIAANGKGSQLALANANEVVALEIAKSPTGFTATSAGTGTFVRDLANVKPCAGAPVERADHSIAMPGQGSSSSFVIDSFSPLSSGCFDVVFESGQRARACMPRELFPFEVGDTLSVQGIDIVGVRKNGVETRLRVQTAVPSSKPDLSCAWVDMCGTIGFDTELEVDGHTFAAGDDRTIGDTRYVVGRSQTVAVANGFCGDHLPNAVGLRASIVRIETHSVPANHSVTSADAGTD